MALTDEQIARIVESARQRAGGKMAATAGSPRVVSTGGHVGRSLPGGKSEPDAAMHGVFVTLDEAVRAARKSFDQFREFPLQKREAMVDNIRRRLRENVDLLAQLAHDETKLGRVEDKRKKNLLVIDRTPGPEILRPESQSGDHGLVLTEWAPYGVIGAITPVTNPSETVINNGISMLSAGNTVVFNGHPTAKNVTRLAISLINRAAMEVGAPANLLTTSAQPTLETAQALMSHPDVRLLVVTGGPGVGQEESHTGHQRLEALVSGILAHPTEGGNVAVKVWEFVLIVVPNT